MEKNWQNRALLQNFTQHYYQSTSCTSTTSTMSSSVAKLVPLLDVDDENDLRPILRLHPDKPMVIGRNDVNTAIEEQSVSRELLKLEWRAGKLHCIPLKDQHFVRVGNENLEGEAILNHGDVFSLWKDKYSYQVRYTTKAATTTNSSEQQLSLEAKRKLTDHIACPICLELMVDATILVPCGHRFCKQCCAGPECATCRTAVQSRIQDRLLNGLVSDLVQERCVDADDSSMYLARIGKEVSDSCILCTCT